MWPQQCWRTSIFTSSWCLGGWTPGNPAPAPGTSSFRRQGWNRAQPSAWSGMPGTGGNIFGETFDDFLFLEIRSLIFCSILYTLEIQGVYFYLNCLFWLQFILRLPCFVDRFLFVGWSGLRSTDPSQGGGEYFAPGTATGSQGTWEGNTTLATPTSLVGGTTDGRVMGLLAFQKVLQYSNLFVKVLPVSLGIIPIRSGMSITLLPLVGCGC